MGYDLHITRKQHSSDEDGPAIGLSEWQELIEQDPERQSRAALVASGFKPDDQPG
jgi:hypothetical protein